LLDTHEMGNYSDKPPQIKMASLRPGSVIILDSAKQFGQSVALDYAPQGLEHISLGLNRGDSQRIVNERVCRH
jgi:hypothetical protein